MALIKADRVKETSTTTGTGPLTLAGAAVGYRAFSAVCTTSDTVYYAISHQTANEWETGLGTYSGANTLTRTTVHSSSNSGSAVNFSAGTKEVFLTLTAHQIGTFLQSVVPVADGGTGTSTGSITGTGALTFEAGGTNQHIFLNPSGTGAVYADGVPIRMAGTGYSVSIVETMSNVSTGAWNVSVGGLSGVTTGSYSTATGYGAISGVFTSSYTSAYGYQAGYKNSLGNLLNDPANCTYIGAICRGKDNYETNAIVIGYDARGKGSNTTVLGNSSTTQTWLGGGELRLPGSTSGYVGLKGAAAAGGTTYTLPSADGTSGQMLSTNGSGALSWSTVASSGGTVTSVGGTGTVNGLTLTGTVTSSGSLTLGGTLSGVDLTTQVTGTLPIANGGTGQTTAANAVNALLPTQTSNSGKFLTTNGTASSWATVSASPAGSSGQVQYNNSGSFAGAINVKIRSGGYLNASDTSFNSCASSDAFTNLTSGVGNACFGSGLSALTSGSRNFVFGSALGSLTTGSDNVAVGNNLGSLQSGFHNVGIGAAALGATTGNYNIGIGYDAGLQILNGSYNTCIGADAGYMTFPFNASFSYVTCLGYRADPSSKTVQNEITLGNTSVNALRCQATTITSLSDQRDKTNIQPMPSVLSFIASLNPVQFDWWMRDGAKIGVPDYGFIAQELQQAQSSNGFDWAQLVYESNPDKLEASPGKLIPILVKAIQELAAKVAALEAAV